MRPVLKPEPQRYQTDDYDVMRMYLIEALGAYCSYCEQPVSNDTAVEHKVPKAVIGGLGAFSTRWDNLLLACASCNSAKGRTPRPADAPPGAPGDESLFVRTLGLWVWPDPYPRKSTVAPDAALDVFQFVYDSRSQKQLLDDGLVRHTLPAATPAWASTPQTQVWVVPNATYVAKLPATVAERVKRTLLGLNLNAFNAADPRASNRRVPNRTAAYLAANDLLATLAAFFTSADYTGPAGAPKPAAARAELRRLMVLSARQAAVATGFWSVWWQVFSAALAKPAAGASPWGGLGPEERKEILTRTLLWFYPAERGNQEGVTILPGTDATRVPLPAFA